MLTRALFIRYEVHAVVFLFKAFSYGAVTQQEHDETSKLVRAFIERLRRASSGYAHIANRYAVLLSHLLSSGSLRNQRPSMQDNAGESAMGGQPARQDGFDGRGQSSNLQTDPVHSHPSDVRSFPTANSNDIFASWPDFGSDNSLFPMDGSLDFLPFPGPSLDGFTGI